MILRLIGLAVCASMLLTLSAEAREKRALIIGVGAYDELTDLEKSVGDATGYADFFRDSLGYQVTELIDPDRRAFLTAFDGFLASIEPGDEVVFIYSGHGWSDRSENYLVLSDAPLAASETLMKSETIPITETVLAAIKARGPKVTFAIIDACRNYPFDSLTRNAFGRGLVRTDVSEGMLVLYSAGSGQQALDRLGPDDPEPVSVFTRVLLPNLAETDTPLPRIARETKMAVRDLAAQVGHEQNPAYYDELLTDFCLSGECSSDVDSEQTLWLRATSAPTPEESCVFLLDYLDAYPAGQFVAMARMLTQASNCLEDPPPVPDAYVGPDITEPSFTMERVFGELSGNNFSAIAPAEDGTAWLAGVKGAGYYGAGPFFAIRMDQTGQAITEASWGEETPGWAYAAAPAPDGGLWVAGSLARGVEPSDGGIAERGYLARLDADGNVLFTRRLALEGWSRMYGAAPAEDGGVWITGFLNVGDDWQRKSVYVLRLDAEGNTVFERAYEGAMGEQAFAITARPGGGAYIAGQTAFTDDEAGADAFLMQVDEAGELVWEKRTQFPGYDIALGVDAREDGGFYLVGYTEDETGRQGFMVSIKADQSLGWSCTIGDGGTGLNSVVALPGGGAWIGGYTTLRPGNYDAQDPTLTTPNAYLVRIDGKGDVVEEQSYGAEGRDSISGMALGSDDRIWVVGSVENPATEVGAAFVAQLAAR